MNELKKYEELKNKLHDAVNELCVLCGKYQFEHIGMCDGCRWKQEKTRMDERVNNSICPFVRSGECDVPPCNSCFLYHVSCHEDKKEQREN